MKKGDIKWAVLRIEGTNSEDESAQCMRDVGVQAEIVHLKQLTGSGHYECRPSLLRHVNLGNCKFTTGIPPGDVRTVITSHAEGKFMLPSEKEYKRLFEQDQVFFQYTDPQGHESPKYPWLPN